LAVSCNNASQRIKTQYLSGKPAWIYFYPDHTDTTTFISIEYYPNGKIHKRDTVQKGRIVGNHTVYYPDGSIYELMKVTNLPRVLLDPWDGFETRYYKNGIISQQFVYKNGQVDGPSKHYNSKGVLVKAYYLKDTTKEGEYNEYYTNGRVSYKVTFLHNVPIGKEYYFDEKGDTAKYYEIDEKGDESFPYKRWLNNGIILQGDFLDSSGTIAVWIWFSRGGREIKRMIQHSNKGIFVSPEPN
jgi:antitoxin component YwqK of YwqJK toxin-antitoxin module